MRVNLVSLNVSSKLRWTLPLIQTKKRGGYAKALGGRLERTPSPSKPAPRDGDVKGISGNYLASQSLSPWLFAGLRSLSGLP